MNQVLDLTLPLGPRTPLYPGDLAPRLSHLTSIAKGDRLTASAFQLGCHVGTHVDLPSHFRVDGRALGDYPIEAFVGRAVVLELTDVAERLGAERLRSETIPENRHILMKTRNSEFLHDSQFRKDYVFVEPDAVRLMLKQRPRSIGIDYYSLDPPQSRDYPAHMLCAERGIPVFVALCLGHVQPGEYWFAGLPLRMNELEGCPVRAILWQD